MPVVLTVTYIVLVHLAVVYQAPLMQWLALVLLCVIPQYRALRSGRWRHWLLLAVLAAGLYALTRAGGGIYALFLPPIVLPGMLLTVFAGSLRPGRVPLVVKLAEASAGPLGEDRKRHCRQVTWAWVFMLGAQVIAAIALALFGPLWLWSLVTNVVNYLLMGVLFLLEYLVRRLRFRREPHQSFVAYLRSLTQARYGS
jgi:uncharacterized membrane protein